VPNLPKNLFVVVHSFERDYGTKKILNGSSK
jgi:hypothetical protein